MKVNTQDEVANIMTKNVRTVGASDLLYDAIRKMEIESTSAFPVVDSAGTLVGILSSSDLVNHAYNLECDLSSLSAVSEIVRKTLTDVLAEDNCETKVSSVMTDSVETISLNASITDAAQSIIDNEIHHLPVVDDVGKPIGIVSVIDIIRSVAFPV